MGNQSASRLHGDDYQHLFSWLKILELLDPHAGIEYIWVENPSAGAADDLTIHPKDPVNHPTKYFQVKAHRDLSESYTMEKLAILSSSGSKSLLQSLWGSWQQLWVGRQGDIEIWLVSDWRVDKSLGKQIRSKQFKDGFFKDFSNTRTKVGKECQKWKNHLKVNSDKEFTEFCRSLRFELGYQIEHLWELTQARMRSYDMKSEDAAVWNGIGIVREWIKEGRREKITENKLLKKVEQENLWENSVRLVRPIHLIEQQFDQETTKALQNVRREIPGIGFIPRQEAQLIEDQLTQQKAVILAGDAGTGKSGIAATLANSALDKGKVVLLLDSRSVSHIYDESELQRYLNLDCVVSKAIKQAANYKGCRLIVDQLDNVIGSRTAELLISLALTCRDFPGAEIIVISRRSTGLYKPSEMIRLIRKGFVEQASSLLDEITAKKALRQLDISEPNAELIKLACTLLYLETISLIRRENPFFPQLSSLTNDIMLWEKYLETVSEREAVGFGSNHASKVIAEAKRLASAGLMNEETEFSLEDPISQIQQRLIGTVLTHLSGRIYRFRHEELQYFLYAKSATETGEMPLDVFQKIGHRSRNVLPWMKKLYFHHSNQSEYARAMYKRFMKESFNVR